MLDILVVFVGRVTLSLTQPTEIFSFLDTLTRSRYLNLSRSHPPIISTSKAIATSD
ncbi:hypothetical protein [Spirulina sp. 06S082]|uniref:hypothetical protein n=1 Tax=Spirulina sp. 06S082 TaxID=3110248 RepID=UPI002B1FF32E|nr:hypothetical protein [Spirulina sp. 06S082]MEA5470846.1 hypothetical protein [Spirulina sp. 06S082]